MIEKLSDKENEDPTIICKLAKYVELFMHLPHNAVLRLSTTRANPKLLPFYLFILEM